MITVLWIDDIIPAPDNYVWCKSVNEAKKYIANNSIIAIDTDTDAGYYARYGGNYIKLLEWLEENNYNIPIRIHYIYPEKTVDIMKNIIERNSWKEFFEPVRLD